MSGSTNSDGGLGGAGLLGVLFVGLKLGGVIDWPWVWVLAPFWGSLVFVVASLALLWLLFKSGAVR